MMVRAGQVKLAKEYGLQPFNGKVLAPIRTICEKIMSLVRFSYGDNPIKNLQKKIWHAYDLHQLLSAKEFSEFFYSDAFVDILLKVGQDDVTSYKSNNRWLKNHPNEAIIFKDLDKVWDQLKGAYNNDFKKLAFGDDFPTSEEILITLHKIKDRLSPIHWTVTIPE